MRASRLAAIVLVLLTVYAAVSFAWLHLSREASAGGTTYTVTLTGDAGDGTCDATCTLRDALLAVSGSQGNTVAFMLPGCPGTPANCVISPTSALTPISQLGTRIDGTTQPGYNGTPIVVIDGSSVGAGIDGLAITGDLVEVSGVVIREFPNRGIQASSPVRTRVHDER